MSNTIQIDNHGSRLHALLLLASLTFFASSIGAANAGIAYGSINNFDTVNDTGVECHGFEIELDDIRSADITYTFDWNHYGTPRITEDTTSIPGHTNVQVRYQAVWTNTNWSAYTAIPSGPIAPTQGHQFTDPSVNFGGEHFGVGYSAQPTSVKYNWLIDDGTHSLVHGPPVSVSTPTFTYIPPVPGVAPAQIQAAIQPPPAPIVLEFGPATWVKEIRTTSHNNTEVRLRNLVDPDPDNPNASDWRNGEPDEVEVEWQILQIDTMSAGGGANGELVAAAQNLNHGDDVVTRRYEFYEYAGPIDTQTDEALAQVIAPNGINGVGVITNNDVVIDLSTLVIVGQFLGAQMSAAAAVSPLGLIDHLPDGEVDTPYATRSVVITGDTNFTATSSGSLPDGLAFDPTTGQVSGTPTTDGVFLFTVSVSSGNSPVVTKYFPLIVAAAGVVLPPHSSVDTSVSPADGGTATGTGVYTNDTPTTVVATPKPGFAFANWTENDKVVSTSASYSFTNIVNQSLVANFVPAPWLSLAVLQPNTLAITWPTNFSGFVLQENLDLRTPNWASMVNAVVTVAGTNNQVIVSPPADEIYFRLFHP